MNTKIENVAVIYEGEKVIGIVHRDPKTGHKIIYSCEKADMDKIVSLLNPPEKQV